MDEPLRARILQKLSTDADQVRFDDIVTECVNFLSTEADCQLFSQEQVQLNAMQKPPNKSQHRQRPPASQSRTEHRRNSNVPPSTCYRCGSLHWYKYCPYKKHKCYQCRRTGHLEQQCHNIRTPKSHSLHPESKNSKIGLVQIGTVHHASKSRSLLQMAIDVNKARVLFYLDTGGGSKHN